MTLAKIRVALCSSPRRVSAKHLSNSIEEGQTVKILLADSDPAFSKNFADVVRVLDGETRIAKSAGEAYSALGSFRPDVAVASRDLPADGPRDLVSLLADGPFASIPTILLVSGDSGLVTVAGDVVAVTLQRPVRAERLAMICECVRRFSRESVPALCRGLSSASVRTTSGRLGAPFDD